LLAEDQTKCTTSYTNTKKKKKLKTGLHCVGRKLTGIPNIPVQNIRNEISKTAAKGSGNNSCHRDDISQFTNISLFCLNNRKGQYQYSY